MTTHLAVPLRASAAAALALALAGCATDYQPAASAGDTGYDVTQIASDRYRVSFVGNAATSRETVETYLLYRAAETAAQAGAPYFAIVRQTTDRDVDVNVNPLYTSELHASGYGADFGVGAGYGFPYYSGFRYGGRQLLTTTDSYQAYATIETLQSRPAGREDVYDTQAVLTALRPRIDFAGS
jgi:hypothetical protein